MIQVNQVNMARKMNRRIQLNKLSSLLFLAATLLGLVVLAVLIYRVISQGIGWINFDFLTGKLSTQPERAGIMGAILGTFWLMLVVAPVTMFLGVGTAVYFGIVCEKRTPASFDSNEYLKFGWCSIHRLWDFRYDRFCQSHGFWQRGNSGGLDDVAIDPPNCHCSEPRSHSRSAQSFK